MSHPSILAPPWDPGAPMPCLLTGMRTFLVYYLRGDDPVFDRLNPGEPGWDQEYGVGVVEFRHVVAIKMGSPNDEVLRGHPLYGYGLEGYGAQVVSNSPWISELADVNRVHPQFRQENWAPARHYLLPFHDETAECVAHDATSWTELRPMDEVVASSPPPHCGRPDSNVALSEPKVDAFGSMICLGGVCAPG